MLVYKSGERWLGHLNNISEIATKLYLKKMTMQMIEYLHIDNYKSIKQLSLSCSRINVLIGEPNVGKSNILEALDLSYLSWFLAANQDNEKGGKEKIDIKKYFRVRKVSDLFHFGDISKPISIIHPGFSIGTELKLKVNESLDRKKNSQNLFKWQAGSGFTEFDNDFLPVENAQYYSSPIKPYRFKENIQFHDIGNYLNTLMSPFGNNLIELIHHNPSFKEFVGEFLQEYQLELNSDIATHTLSIQKRINQGLVYSIPYNGLADTLRRIIFYTAAIRYSNAHVITLEEPDTHSFPKFVSFLADEIIQCRDRQFFIATHNPYLLNNLIENTPSKELSVFVCGYHKTKGTVATKLSSEDLSELLDYGVDIFFNINRYLDDRINYSS